MNAIGKRCGACRRALLNDRRDYCNRRCKRDAAYARERLLRGTKTPRKRRLATTPLDRVRNGPKNSIGTVACKPPSTPDLGAVNREQIEAQGATSNPVRFSTPDATKCRVWLASARKGNLIIGDDRWWRVNVADLLKQKKTRASTSWRPTPETYRRPIIVVGRNAPVRDMDDALGVLKGFRVRLYIEDEKELQILGCGWRIITCQFRRNTVLLHHHGSVATMKRRAFNGLVTANRRLRRKRPNLRLVVSNPAPRIAETKQAA
jgi:hypothetical protein